MKFKAILFDMDGTLVPMDTNYFTKAYFKILYAKLAKYGLDPAQFGKNMWAGVEAMVRNDGNTTNADRFWEVFEKLIGIDRALIENECISFYGNEFNQAKQFTEDNPFAAEAVRLAHEKSEIVILATNPLFPMVGQITRMNWVGLSPQDFDLVTAYEEERFCKPNSKYFTEICTRMNLNPSECLMIGNDENEDMFAATTAGLNCWLITDWMIPSEDHPWNGLRGTFAETIQMLRDLSPWNE